ncbi:hypothetical protein DESUT3_15210 [Desulfuromonas versatilis]|uniref:MoaD/ThiS family protein n=1 Tax=Desulfuromonas versatilis TaxID=2802975 RepID=A0ABM8HRA9_9BACT|nr:MoaD/ThiS family protein [Desulfuromonas versatilis]BCR04452.1 hypothetical protein DESUT3_15210 [Desulfuromonas versatilis]
MQITVKLFATFRVGRFKIEQRSYPAQSTARAVLEDVGVTEEELGILMVNGRHGNLDQPLCEGDTVSLFPLVGGG